MNFGLHLLDLGMHQDLEKDEKCLLLMCNNFLLNLKLNINI